MGTVVSIDIRGTPPHNGALADVVAWLHHVDETFSTYRPESEISRFGRGELHVDDLTSETRAVLARCVELRSITDGAFDIESVPAPNGTHLDPSGYVKGWAIERAAAMLEAAGAHVLCINAGGDVAVRGLPGRHVGLEGRHPPPEPAKPAGESGHRHRTGWCGHIGDLRTRRPHHRSSPRHTDHLDRQRHGDRPRPRHRRRIRHRPVRHGPRRPRLDRESAMATTATSSPTTTRPTGPPAFRSTPTAPPRAPSPPDVHQPPAPTERGTS